MGKDKRPVPQIIDEIKNDLGLLKHQFEVDKKELLQHWNRKEELDFSLWLSGYGRAIDMVNSILKERRDQICIVSTRSVPE